MSALGRRIFLEVEVILQDRLRNVPERFAQIAALPLQKQMRSFFTQIELLHQQALRSLHDLPRLEGLVRPPQIG